LIRLIQVGLTMLTGFSTAPCGLPAMLGFFFTFLGFCIFIYILAVYFLLGSIPAFHFGINHLSVQRSAAFCAGYHR
jgi:undecaprenyl-phosphate 4-deoxy-4-formamido-L-arabinose transferase